ncbi:hypothetical protein KXW98_002587 [Aspergillus fumigatus]|uniref:Uncharacterized protein n=2 Tax=Aspergillus fumigatus TaxID=746128 RepID=Q4X0K3_ASPFU|nr:hypothetical protein AFUA_2G13180 [Aspergillus fumigatus Af293]EDP54822.1 hypothetical protein AFUB_028820 [Aspergillus fumigatus A1163]KAF4277653.1 hypothetical protein CNMCM8057_002481 [Aspergillus fumigatus]EAL93612.1 hypothetical protein AFUA_2G13180 [Aspergillus fumigatus Af293]KAF4284131.1 hypothetical protein CNMCM8689_006552 [Aspergillus fumigatus]KAF4293373.1 hypothetical protein CNMCM8686_006159 [Aspergillus fumigatus]
MPSMSINKGRIQVAGLLHKPATSPNAPGNCDRTSWRWRQRADGRSPSKKLAQESFVTVSYDASPPSREQRRT